MWRSDGVRIRTLGLWLFQPLNKILHALAFQQIRTLRLGYTSHLERFVLAPSLDNQIKTSRDAAVQAEPDQKTLHSMTLPVESAVMWS